MKCNVYYKNLSEEIQMWNITVYSNQNKIVMYEFKTEIEARTAFQNIKGCKILTEIIYYNDHFSANK